MRRIFLTLIAFLAFQIAAFGQTENSPCPKISIQAPNNVIRSESGDPMVFTALVDDKREEEKFEYIWTVSAGKIVGGQGTPIVELDVKNLETQNITASVEVKGLPQNCAKTASDTGVVMKREPHNCLDTYGKVSWEDEAFEMDQVMFQFWQNSDVSVVFHLNFSKKPTQKQINTRILRMLKFFSYRKRLGELDRVTFVIGEETEEYTRICYYLKGQEKIDFNGGNVIKGVDVDVSSLIKAKKPKK